MSEHTGGTVTQPAWPIERIEPRDGGVSYLLHLVGGDTIRRSRGEVEAMGLVPEPAPLVVECNGHSIELSDEEAEYVGKWWGRFDGASVDLGERLRCKLAGLLRDARQDPQPASDDPVTALFTEQRERIAAQRNQSEQDDTPSDDIDFDALPIGTVLWDGDDLMVRLPGGWTYSPPLDEDDYYDPENHSSPYTVVYQPPALSPRQHLEALLAGRDDADELWAEAERQWRYPSARTPVYRLMQVIGDAAREVRG